MTSQEMIFCLHNSPTNFNKKQNTKIVVDKYMDKINKRNKQEKIFVE